MKMEDLYPFFSDNNILNFFVESRKNNKVLEVEGEKESGSRIKE